MIFVTVGTQKFQFNRLLKKIDKLVDNNQINQTVICQSGYSTYKPKHYNIIPFMSKERYIYYIRKCDVLITHAGVGTILSAKKYKKPVIVVPRLKNFNEHVDNHQLQIAEGFNQKKLVVACNTDNLDKAIKKVKIMNLKSYISNQKAFVWKLDNILNEI